MSDETNSKILGLFKCSKTGSNLSFSDDQKALVNNADEVVAVFDRGVWIFSLHSESMHEEANQTLSVFGNEWTNYDKWGWLQDYPNEKDAKFHYRGGLVEDTKRSLHTKTFLSEKDFEGKILLDAGCGNGRHASESSKLCETLICVDASEAIFAASKNLKERKNVVFVQASLFELPLKKSSVDVVYSIGVMQHTGNASLMLKSLQNILKKDGKFGLNCYGTGHFGYEIIDYSLRYFITKMSKVSQHRVSEIFARTSIIIEKIPIFGKLTHKIIYSFINLQPSRCIMFDWYSPILAEHYSRKKLKRLFNNYDLKVEHSNVPMEGVSYKALRRFIAHGAFELKLSKLK